MDPVEENLTTLVRGPGRDDRLFSEYQIRQFNNENESVKQPQRLRILRHLLDHHDGNKRMTYLGLPGSSWEFEKQLDDQHGEQKPRYVGLEWSYGIMERGRPHMPGGRSYRRRVSLKTGIVHGFSTSRAEVLWADASSFLNVQPEDLFGVRGLWWWSHNYFRVTAAWLDFTSPLCAETINSLQRFPACCKLSRQTIPFAATLLLAREPAYVPLPENGTVIEKRAGLVKAALESNGVMDFDITDAWQYQSANDVPMGVVAGVLTRRS